MPAVMNINKYFGFAEEKKLEKEKHFKLSRFLRRTQSAHEDQGGPVSDKSFNVTDFCCAFNCDLVSRFSLRPDAFYTAQDLYLHSV